MDKIGKRKAVLMSVSALLIVALFYAIFSSDLILPAYFSNQAVNTRVKTMDTYVKSFERYAQESLEIATYSALNSLYVNASRNGRFYASFEEFNRSFSNCLSCARQSCSIPSSAACTQMNGTDMQSLL